MPASFFLFIAQINIMKTIAIIPAAGTGVRMESSVPKQFMELKGMPILALTLDKFNECPLIDGIIPVVPSDEMDSCKNDIVNRYGYHKVIKIVAGGKRRQDSVRAGIEATEGRYDIILIHDGVRPFINRDIIENSINALAQDRAVITAIPAKDTIKEVDKEGYVLNTYERKHSWLVQTPQVFRYVDIYKAHMKAKNDNWEEVTDDARLMEKMGVKVKVIIGSEDNIKITTPHDLQYAEFLLGRGI